jgi:hypothetical protein
LFFLDHVNLLPSYQLPLAPPLSELLLELSLLLQSPLAPPPLELPPPKLLESPPPPNPPPPPQLLDEELSLLPLPPNPLMKYVLEWL